MNLGSVASRVKEGESVTFKATGTSMTPRITNGSLVTVRPLDPTRVLLGDVVLAKVSGRWYLHLVSAVRSNQVQISNAKGRVNGWTALENVVGVADR